MSVNDNVTFNTFKQICLAFVLRLFLLLQYLEEKNSFTSNNLFTDGVYLSISLVQVLLQFRVFFLQVTACVLRNKQCCFCLPQLSGSISKFFLQLCECSLEKQW